eukprot:1145532-Pelagomonas_calceolata.AAC.4
MCMYLMNGTASYSQDIMKAPNIFHLLDVIPHIRTKRNWWTWMGEASLVVFVLGTMGVDLQPGRLAAQLVANVCQSTMNLWA